MRRTLAAAALAAPLLCLAASPAAAHNGPNTFGLKCGGWALRSHPYMHQHGPLFNYGPYHGYYPFEPYGPWDAYLRYQGGGTGGGGGAYGWINGWQPGSHLPSFNFGWGQHGCSHCGGGHHLFHRHASHGCNSCGAAAAAVVTSGPAEDRYTGFGHPAASAAFYAETPNLIVPVGGTTAP